FSLRPSQRAPLNVFIPLEALQRRLDQEGRVNAILAPALKENPQETLKRDFDLSDVGLALRRNQNPPYLSVETARVFLPPYLADVVLKCAAALKVPAAPTLAYLVNTMRIGERSIPYSMAAAIDDGATSEGQVLLNEWAARELQARQGDSIELGYYVSGPRGQLMESTTTLTVAGAIPMADPRVDRGLVPDFPGISDAKSFSDWDPPFPLDLKRIRPRDEKYWDEYRATPKAFVSLNTGQELWRNPYGDLTSIRLFGADEAAIRQAPREAIDPARAGLGFQPVKEQALAASQGASDFGGLFLGFSLFLLVSAGILIQILFRLGVEGRAKQFGLLRAVGFAARRARRLMLAEGALVAAAGAIVGVALGVLYARALIGALHSWWIGAIGAAFLRLEVRPASVAIGVAGGWLVAMLSIWRAASRLSRVAPRALLAGKVAEERAGGKGRRAPLAIALGLLAVGVGLVGAARWVSAQAQAGLFFGAGAALLASCLAFFHAWLRGEPRRALERLTLTRLGIAGARRSSGRSLMVAGLVACATFVIVAVGANRRVASESLDKHSGAGGFTLLAESSLPLYRALEPHLPADGKSYAFRLKPGDDASCLNLYQAASPRILGASEEFIDRGGFAFSQTEAGTEAQRRNPWLLLRRPLTDGAIPAIGDYNTVVWLLHSGLGKTLVIGGKPFRIVALLEGSVFQSELLIWERNFDSLYPEESGWRFFAIETPTESMGAVEAALESTYADFGLDVRSAADALNELMAVENTYLTTFQALGALGFLLGTLGLALALARNLIERRGELALLRAIGWPSRALLWLAVSENALLLLAGMVGGTLCALLAVAPALAARQVLPPWPSLLGSLAGVFAFGLAAAAFAAAAVLRAPALRALKEE
ncbi:MAG: FtsX-like permease family protein, partial [Candidatus Sumerlaeota bacterium]|nr:FtsX-like permease family protein [Candidatus Sumerlaeota bacterium]